MNATGPATATAEPASSTTERPPSSRIRATGRPSARAESSPRDRALSAGVMASARTRPMTSVGSTGQSTSRVRPAGEPASQKRASSSVRLLASMTAEVQDMRTSWSTVPPSAGRTESRSPERRARAWATAPATPSAAPTARPTTVRGSRRPVTTMASRPWPSLNRASTTVDSGTDRALRARLRAAHSVNAPRPARSSGIRRADGPLGRVTRSFLDMIDKLKLGMPNLVNLAPRREIRLIADVIMQVR
jgi:hypothetical protein